MADREHSAAVRSIPYGSFARSTPAAMPNLGRQVLNLLRERAAAARIRSRVRRELNQCSDRALSDLGLGRADIEDVACGRCND